MCSRSASATNPGCPGSPSDRGRESGVPWGLATEVCPCMQAPGSLSLRSPDRCHPAPTFIAVPHRVKVDVVLVVSQEQEAEPGVEGIDGHDEEQADDITLFLWHRVGAQVQVDLGAGWFG